jgi:hypothetical protein
LLISFVAFGVIVTAVTVPSSNTETLNSTGSSPAGVLYDTVSVRVTGVHSVTALGVVFSGTTTSPTTCGGVIASEETVVSVLEAQLVSVEIDAKRASGRTNFFIKN